MFTDFDKKILSAAMLGGHYRIFYILFMIITLLTVNHIAYSQTRGRGKCIGGMACQCHMSPIMLRLQFLPYLVIIG